MMKMVVTGTGRCGTGYMAKVLSGAGLPCGHEEVFGPHGWNPHSKLPADSSWLAVPFLPVLEMAHCSIVQVYRNPGAVISSLLGIKFFSTPSAYRNFIVREHPELATMSEFDACCYTYNVWNRKIIGYADLVTNIDDVAWEKIIKLTGSTKLDLASAIPEVPQTYNHRHRANLDTSLIPTSVWDTYQMLEDASSGS